jgi:predicted peptidase
MRYLKFHYLVVLALINCALFSQGQKEASWMELYEPVEDGAVPYRLMKPAGYDVKELYPVIVSLHGGGGKGTDNKKQLKVWNEQLADKDLRKEFPCYVLAPQAEGLWDEGHLKEIKSIISKLPSVDMDRIYILGHSMGGHGTFILIQLDLEYFAAAAPSAGTGLKTTEPFIDAEKIKDIPIWAFHGDQDNVCPYARDLDLFKQMKQSGGNMKLTTFKGDRHGISGKFIHGSENGFTELASAKCDPEEDLMKWLFKQKLSDRER